MEEFFGGLVGILILLFVVGWFIETYPGVVWTIVLVVVGAFVARFLIKQIRAENARRSEEKRAANLRRAEEVRVANARRAEEAARQLAYYRQIHSACDESVVAFESIPRDLMTAEELLDAADSDFQDGAFSPFWDSIERAMRRLGAIDSSIKLIAGHSNQYKAIAKSYQGQVPPFPVNLASAHRLTTANATADRLQMIVRKAQRNFQFATIYEQRKTSEILIAGFTNLGEAVHGVGARLQQSIGVLGDQINDLSSSMTVMSEQVVEAVRDVSWAVEEVSLRVGDVSSAIKDTDTKTQAAIADQATRQENANRMLDNIQRHRVPHPLADY